MNYLVLDLETSDPWIDQGRGPGWPEKQTKILCAASHLEVRGLSIPQYWENPIALVAQLELFNELYEDFTIVAHNAQYEAGTLYSYGFDIESVRWIDTAVLARLYNNELGQFGLDFLSKHYLNQEKNDDPLGIVATELGLVKSKAQDPVKVAKKNMEKIFNARRSLVREYVEQDVALTKSLFQLFSESVSNSIDFYSDLIKALTLSRAKGVRIHIPTARKVQFELLDLFTNQMRQVEELAPGLNINSSKQLAEYFDQQNVEYPRTEKGNPSITKAFLDVVDHPLGELIRQAKKYEKYRRDYIEPILGFIKENEEYVKVYPEIKIHGAAATGRATCANPNLQQMPKRDPEGAIVRTIYHPWENENWYSLDFSAQEPRLQVHYAAKIGAAGADLLVQGYRENAHLDLHQRVAELAGITRSEAKTINLGLSYGMGTAKLAASLKLDEYQAKELKNKLNKITPFLATLEKHARTVMEKRGFIWTLLERRLYNEQGFSRKALNKLIQGSAADQMWDALVQLYRQGIPFLFPIHDSIEISAANDDVALKVKSIMETSLPLLVPSVAEIEKGTTWGTLKKMEV